MNIETIRRNVFMWVDDQDTPDMLTVTLWTWLWEARGLGIRPDDWPEYLRHKAQQPKAAALALHWRDPKWMDAIRQTSANFEYWLLDLHAEARKAGRPILSFSVEMDNNGKSCEEILAKKNART